MKKKFFLRGRLRSQRGETLMEALAACLIIAVSISMVAQVMGTAAHVIQQSRTIQENSDKIMAAFWADNTGGQKVQNTGELNFEGKFSIKAALYKYDVTADDLSATVYEFQSE